MTGHSCQLLNSGQQTPSHTHYAARRSTSASSAVTPCQRRAALFTLAQQVTCLAEREFACRDQQALVAVSENSGLMNRRVGTTNTHPSIIYCCRWKTNALKRCVIRSPLIIYLHLVTIMKMLDLDREQKVMASFIEAYRTPKPPVVSFLTPPR